ncbi:MAG: ATP-binding protein [Ruminococcus sp.]|nr:ATP-binding protein [Ruminococcus sp.]
MKEFKPIPIGVEDFKEIIDKGSYYVDKTGMIQELLDSNAKVNLFTRPRRFGKTLNISMLQRFFEKTDEDNAYLFNGLNIAKAGEKYMQHQGQYPVISLSLKSMKQPDYSKSFGTFKDAIKREFWRHKDVLSSNEIVPEDREIFSQITHGTAEDDTYITAIRTLSDCLYAAYQKKVIILIDEYDVPLETSHFRGFYDEMVDLIRSVFESALKTNPYLEFGVLTGCLRVSKESIFTGLNNLNVYTITDGIFSEYFGFTEKEVKKIAHDFQIQDKFDEMKEWYDGYLFGETEIYNPWSILKYVLAAITEKNVIPKPYWSNTSSNDIIHELVVNGNEETHNQIEALMNGESLTKPIYEDITYRNININTDYIWSFLLFTGYLKPISMHLEGDLIYAEMVIPNREVGTVYKRMIMQWFDEKVRSTSRDDLFTAMINGNVDEFETLLGDWLDETISYYDSKENYYHGFLSGLLVGFKGYDVKSNRESGDGRPDLLVLERKRHKLAVILEIKVAEKFRDLDAKCDEALQQIETNRYEAELKYDCFQKILKYGVAFCDKACQVKLEVEE